MNKENMNFLLNLARKSIESNFTNNKVDLTSIPNDLKEVRSCFVTLTINDELRGCIGNLEAFEPIYQNVINNALNAAFQDNRFSPLSFKELAIVKIEISVLSSPERLFYFNYLDLLNKLSSDMGVILKKGRNQATFLPQVWTIYPDKVEFLENLCVKAGLFSEAWKENIDVFIYTVEKFSE